MEVVAAEAPPRVVLSCWMSNSRVKLMGQIVKCLAKIGSHMFIESSSTTLLLRALNDSRSAFAAFILPSTLFTAFDAQPTLLKSKILLKSCLAVFRNVQSVESMRLCIDVYDARVIFDMRCKDGVRKCFKVVYEECGSMEAVYNKGDCPNLIVSKAKPFSDCLSNLRSEVTEVTLTPMTEALRVKGFADATRADSRTKQLQTEMSLDPNDFDEYRLTAGAGFPITHSIRELRVRGGE